MLDEPFVSLDPSMAVRARDVVVAAWRARPTAILLVTHDAKEAAAVADRVLLLSRNPGPHRRRTDHPRSRSPHRLRRRGGRHRRRAVGRRRVGYRSMEGRRAPACFRSNGSSKKCHDQIASRPVRPSTNAIAFQCWQLAHPAHRIDDQHVPEIYPVGDAAKVAQRRREPDDRRGAQPDRPEDEGRGGEAGESAEERHHRDPVPEPRMRVEDRQHRPDQRHGSDSGERPRPPRVGAEPPARRREHPSGHDDAHSELVQHARQLIGRDLQPEGAGGVARIDQQEGAEAPRPGDPEARGQDDPPVGPPVARARPAAPGDRIASPRRSTSSAR